MSAFRKVLGTTHHFLGHSHVGLWLAEKLRNQCETIIARAHGTAVGDAEENGEAGFLKSVALSIAYFVDVGANRGNWAARVLDISPLAKGLLFDPSRSAVAILQQRFAQTSGIEVLEAAVGESPGSLPFFEEDEAGETSSLVGAVSRAANCRQVPVTTLDSEVKNRNWPRVDYLKIDAEGYDFRALHGAKALLSEGLVHLGQFEYGAGWRYTGATITYAITWLADLGYDCYVLTGRGLLQPNPDRFREYFQYSNYVFVRSDLKQALFSASAPSVFRSLY
jgi:FkbM family methyltransferase